jgi:hypothetical protein
VFLDGNVSGSGVFDFCTQLGIAVLRSSNEFRRVKPLAIDILQSMGMEYRSDR